MDSYEKYLSDSLQKRIVGISASIDYGELFMNLSAATSYLYSLAIERFSHLHAAELRNLASDD